ncbi:DgyrCDS550 [Dimorphilus gyrociliatus]|uniref:DgyrCDS550 n=1 Tax=Dimorphilus gyrociliatus TaxID=2664684 RepID=A0A7I8V502_9ANNE|nr:DgyrCDS550 [Dimorphilus gyrociliatus]
MSRSSTASGGRKWTALKRKTMVTSALGNKLRKKPGTPDKTTTPGTEANAEEEKKVIVNEEILRLAIKHEDLVKLRKEEKTPEPTQPLREISIRRERPEKEWKKPPSKRIAVAKEAPNDAPLRPYNLKDGAGPRFDHFGRIVPHSILGDAYTYQRNAIETGQWPNGAVIEYPVQEMKVKNEKKRERKIAFEEEEHKALENWEKKMRERRRQQGYLSKLLNKKPENLVMNQADGYKKTQERRDIIDKALPLVEDGKGYRYKSEFWNQHEWFGGEETGIFAALSESQKGNHQPIEKVGVPRTVMREKGIDPLLPPSTPSSKPWHQTQYLKKRQEQLAELVREIDPYDPQFQTLEVIGSNKPVEIDRLELKSRETTFTRSENQMGDIGDILTDDPLAGIPDIPAPVQGPSIVIEGKQLDWEGDSHSKSDETALVARVVFECISGERKTEMFQVKNNGSTAIYYNWNKIEKSNPFDQVNRKIQRFYFNTNGGVILPGDTKRFPIVFKSSNYGIFSETWQFHTHPVVASGASIFVTLKGVALQVDKYEKERKDLEIMLTHKEAEETVGMILESILNGVRTPERPATPIDAYLTEAEEFKRKNPTLLYSSDTIEKLKLIYKSTLPPTETEEARVEYVLAILLKLQAILSIPEEEDRKQDILSQFNQHVFALSLKPVTPISELLYQHAYSIICDMVDRISSTVSGVRHQLGLPDTDTGDSVSLNPLQPELEMADSLVSLSSDGEGKKQSAPSGGKKGVKEKPSKGGKEVG